MTLRLLRAPALAWACLFVPAGHAQAVEINPPQAEQGSVGETPHADPPAAAPPSCCNIPGLTIVELEIVDPASSRTSKNGDKVRIRVAEPVSVDGKLAIPAGTEGVAEVIQASKARMMGKAGELTLGAAYVELRGQRIGLKRLRYGPSSGKGNDMTATVATALIGLPGMLISGGNIDIASGARANAVVTANTFIAAQP